MLKITGLMINFIDRGTYKGENGEVPTKAKIQILVDVPKYDGSIEKKLFNISIPNEKIAQYQDKINKDVLIDVVLRSKEYSFYGI